MEKVLTKAEEQLMQILWKLGKGGLREINDAIPAKSRPHINTIATVLKILAEKGFVNIESVGRINSYSPSISKADYSKRSIKSITKSYFDGSYSNVVSFLVESKSVSIDDLELLLKQLKNDKP